MIRFTKNHTGIAIIYLVSVIAELAEIEPTPECINKLSVVLAVIRKCHEVAPKEENHEDKIR